MERERERGKLDGGGRICEGTGLRFNWRVREREERFKLDLFSGVREFGTGIFF